MNWLACFLLSISKKSCWKWGTTCSGRGMSKQWYLSFSSRWKVRGIYTLMPSLYV